MKNRTAIVGYSETPYSRGKIDRNELSLTGEEYAAWASEMALESAGLTKDDIDGQGLGVAGSLWPHAAIWSAEVAQNLGISPKVLIRADQGGAGGAASCAAGPSWSCRPASR